MTNKNLILFILFLGSLPANLAADAHVDGFFRDSIVRDGVFEDNQRIADDSTHSKERKKFFISREERRRNPEKAPSNSIKVERSTFRIRQYPVYPYYSNILAPFSPLIESLEHLDKDKEELKGIKSSD